MTMPRVTRGWLKSPRVFQPFHVLQVNDKQTATQVVPQHIAPFTVAVNNSVRPEHDQSFVALLVKEAGILIVDDMLKPRSRPAQDPFHTQCRLKGGVEAHEYPGNLANWE